MSLMVLGIDHRSAPTSVYTGTMLDAGATLVQIYTGLIYKGPDLVAEIAEALAAG